MNYKEFFKNACKKNRLVMDTINQMKTDKIPMRKIHILNTKYIERIAEVNEGEYRRNPEEVYLKCVRNTGARLLDQYLPDNALKMEKQINSSNTESTATTGAKKIVIDGIEINSPEAVTEHMEKIVFPSIKNKIKNFDEDKCLKKILDSEKEVQKKIEVNILKTGFNSMQFPMLPYEIYGYENYFMAYALYPEIIEKHFSLTADLAVLVNKAIAKATKEYNLPPMQRLGHDMADSRGTMVDIKSLDKIWFPHFTRSIKPAVKADIKIIWHCDGNLMQMLPRLIEAGVKGFQGFQYEDGMDYEKICNMKTKDGENPIIWAGVSSTRTLPYGSPDDVRKEIKWLVEKGPKTGLFIGASSSVDSIVPWDNIRTMIEGLKYYSEHGRVV